LQLSSWLNRPVLPGFNIQTSRSSLPAVPDAFCEGMSGITRRRWLELLERVQQGATLYVSHHDCLLSPFNEPFGVEIQTRQRSRYPTEVRLDGLDEPLELQVGGEIRLEIQPTRAEVLGRAADGNPAFTCADYGRGRRISFPTAGMGLTGAGPSICRRLNRSGRYTGNCHAMHSKAHIV
jgi:hypothetical protein